MSHTRNEGVGPTGFGHFPLPGGLHAKDTPGETASLASYRGGSSRPGDGDKILRRTRCRLRRRVLLKKGETPMEIDLTGTEIQALRDAVEDTIARVVKDLEHTKAPEARAPLVKRESVFRSILQKLPAEFSSAA